MLGVIVNTIAVVLGSLIGLLLRKGVSKKMSDAAMTGVGLCTLYLGFTGTLKGQDALIVILAVVAGGLLGTLIDLDGSIARLGHLVEAKADASIRGAGVSEAFITASLLFCVGSMTIVGSLNAGLTGNNEMLFTKSLLDLISSAMLSVSLGIGVLFSAAFVLVFQGSIVLLAQLIKPLMSEAAIAEMTCVGSVLIIALGLNLLNITKIKVADYLPAILTAPLLVWATGFIQ
ncbi:MAG: DUF554 domain-containing protein [Christensenellales bacterium]|jgi:uncharacterized membrane protein YqgA involved in biofilm formation